MNIQTILISLYAINCTRNVSGFSSSASFFKTIALTGRIRGRASNQEELHSSYWKATTTTTNSYAHRKMQHHDIEPWSFTASWDRDRDRVQIDDIKISHGVHVKKFNGKQYNLSSPREWLEAIEQIDGACGVYTVIRCDINSSSDNVRSWGKDFHLERLSSSYKMLYNSTADTPLLVLERATSVAFRKSLVMYSSMLSHAIKILQHPKVLNTDGDVDGEEQQEDNEIYVVMITLLWQPRKGNHVQDIQVRGHAFCTNKPFSHWKYNPMPTTAVVAFWKNTTSPLLPARYDQWPRAKVSSWCRLRRPLEQRFKLDPDVGEVILTRLIGDDRDKIELLEGLTSNLFIVYSDGTLRTPIGSVLDGYARKLVIEAAQRMGWTVTNDPIYLEDATKGYWREVFLTSSVRMLVPVAKLWIPMNTTTNEWNDGKGSISFRTVWSATVDGPSRQLHPGNTESQWYALYRNIIEHASEDSFHEKI